MATPKKKSPRRRVRRSGMDPDIARMLNEELARWHKEFIASQLPAKRTDADKQAKVFWWLRALRTDRCLYAEALREILAIFGYEVEA